MVGYLIHVLKVTITIAGIQSLTVRSRWTSCSRRKTQNVTAQCPPNGSVGQEATAVQSTQDGLDNERSFHFPYGDSPLKSKGQSFEKRQHTYGSLKEAYAMGFLIGCFQYGGQKMALRTFYFINSNRTCVHKELLGPIEKASTDWQSLFFFLQYEFVPYSQLS